MTHLFNELLGRVRGAGRDIRDRGDRAGPRRNWYSDYTAGYEEVADTVAETTVGMIFHPRRTLNRLNRRRRGLPLEDDHGGMLPRLAQGAGNMAMKGAEFGYEAGYQALRFGAGALRMAGGVQGLGMGAAMVGAQALGGGLRAMQGMELGARFLLTGGITNAPDALSAYLPGWDRHGYNDIRKYGLNPRIAKRYVGFKAAQGLWSGMEEALNPTIAPPQVYLGAGQQIRHRNDMGAHGGYGQKLLGQNSMMSGFSQMSMQQKMMLLDAVI